MKTLFEQGKFEDMSHRNSEYRFLWHNFFEDIGRIGVIFLGINKTCYECVCKSKGIR